MNLLTTSLLVVSAVTLAIAGTPRNVFTGEISDTQCAMNVHSLSRSHQEMVTKSTMGTDAASCAKACVRRGGEWVLRSGDDVYRLKDQDDMEDYAGRKVKIIGILDKKTNTIDNIRIEPAPVRAAH
jgi:hypothetical protein